MKYSFITQHKKTWPIDVMCRLLGVKRSCYYSFQKRDSPRSETDTFREELLEWVHKIDCDGVLIDVIAEGNGKICAQIKVGKTLGTLPNSIDSSTKSNSPHTGLYEKKRNCFIVITLR